MTDEALQQRGGFNVGDTWIGGIVVRRRVVKRIPVAAGIFFELPGVEGVDYAVFTANLFNYSTTDDATIEVVIEDAEGNEIFIDDGTAVAAGTATAPVTDTINSPAAPLVGETLKLRAVAFVSNAYVVVTYYELAPPHVARIPKVELSTNPVTALPADPGKNYTATAVNQGIFNVDDIDHIIRATLSDGVTDLAYAEVSVFANSHADISNLFAYSNGDEQFFIKLRLAEAISTKAPYFRGLAIPFDS